MTEPLPNNELGSLLRQARENLGLTQERAARKIKVNRQTLIDYENGKSEPRYSVIVSMCKLYNLKPESLFKGKCDQSIDDYSLKQLIEALHRKAKLIPD